MHRFSPLFLVCLAVLAGCKTTPPSWYWSVPGAQANYPPLKEPVRVVEAASVDPVAMLRDGYAMTGVVTVFTLAPDKADRDAALVSRAGNNGATCVQVDESMIREGYTDWGGRGGMAPSTSTSYQSYGSVTIKETTTTWSPNLAEPSNYDVYRTRGLAWSKDANLAAQQLADRAAKEKALQLSLELHKAATAGDRDKVRELIAAGAVPNRLGDRHPDLDHGRQVSLGRNQYLLDKCSEVSNRSAVTQVILRGDAAMLDLLLDGMKGRSWSITEEIPEDDPLRYVLHRPQLEGGSTTAPFETGFDRVLAFAAILSEDRADLLQMLIDHGMTSQDLAACDDRGFMSRTESRIDSIARIRRFGSRQILDLLSRDETFAPSIRQAVDSKVALPEPAAAIGGVEALVRAIDLDDHVEMERSIAGGAEVNGEDATGRTPLTAAVQYGCKKALVQLLVHGAKPGQLDGRGLAAIHWVALAGSGCLPDLMLKILLAFGADPNLTARSGYTPYQYAADAWTREVLVGVGATKTAALPTREQLLRASGFRVDS
jgi:ankyrin repeat protein